MAIDLLILGASVRAAVQSAKLAGFRSAGIDQYADRDLKLVAESARWAGEVGSVELERMIGQFPTIPFLYTGPFENHPGFIDRIAEHRPLWGNPGSVLNAVRDPGRLSTALTNAGFRFPDLRFQPTEEFGPWLLKPFDSAGGLRIKAWTVEDAAVPAGMYLQRRHAGDPMSGIFLGDGEMTRLCGTTRQLLGAGPMEFVYLGCVGPVTVRVEVEEELIRLGKFLSMEFGLRGLFGVDFLMDASDIWVIEVNPRYTAAVEILEWTTGRSLLAEHARLFGHQVAGSKVVQPIPFAAKTTIFSAVECQMPSLTLPLRGVGATPPEVWLSDIPEPGETFHVGQPVCTVNVTGSTERKTLDALEMSVSRWTRTLALDRESDDAREAKRVRCSD